MVFVILDDLFFLDYECLINNDVGYMLWLVKLIVQFNNKNLIDLFWFVCCDDYDVVFFGVNIWEFGWIQDQVIDNFIFCYCYMFNSKINNEFIVFYWFN